LQIRNIGRGCIFSGERITIIQLWTLFGSSGDFRIFGTLSAWVSKVYELDLTVCTYPTVLGLSILNFGLLRTLQAHSSDPFQADKDSFKFSGTILAKSEPFTVMSALQSQSTRYATLDLKSDTVNIA